jgi:hypothetical protein
MHLSFNSQQGPPLSGLFDPNLEEGKGESKCQSSQKVIKFIRMGQKVISLRIWERRGDVLGVILCTVRKMDLILHSIQRRPQMQFPMARRFKLQLLRRYSVKFSKMRNFTLGSP